MRTDMLKWIGRFAFLALFQVFILNNIQLFGYLNPYLYVLFILILPADTNRFYSLLWAFALGWTIDIAENSGGIHLSATLTLAFIRPYLLRLVSSSNKELDRISLWTLGPSRFFTYVTVGVFIHHCWLFGLEAFSVREVVSIMTRTLVSVPITLLMIYIAQLFVYREEA